MPVGFPDYYGGLTLPVTVAEGGTGQTSVTSKALLYGAGTSKLIETNVGTANQVLQIDSVTLDPTFKDLVVDVSAITGILPIANGGTGTATPALIAGNGITLSGSWPGQTITNAQYAYFSAGILAIAHGGTGTATPALLAGNGIVLSGSFPAQTVTVANPLKLGDGVTNGQFWAGDGTNYLKMYWDGTNGEILTTSGTLYLQNGAGDVRIQFAAGHKLYVGASSQIELYFDGTNAELRSTSGALYLQNGVSGAVRIYSKLDLYNNVNLVADGIPYLVAAVDLTGQTASIGATTLYTPGTAGLTRFSGFVFFTDATGTSQLIVTITFTYGGVSRTATLFSHLRTDLGTASPITTISIYHDSGTAVKYSTTYSSGGAGDSYDLHLRAENI